ncbi:hypothetical protein [Tenacibaculum caenipelagi]|uniref:SprT-like family protein n=1 Tax=Tenacibaculum caenipelagi TaxID=1325435 RepID=A0A4R6TFK7_9FLAO|nr:hypothetical protein [Tenacibaculum caenipelagi]TDQ23732.1 hypothetical protein DFQ07_2260 [Tenacibaculum caenipelagi]
MKQRNKLNTFLKIVTFLFGVSLLLWNCTQDNTEANNLNFEFKNKFSLEKLNNTFLKNNLIVNWNDYYLEENTKNNSIVYEFSTSLKGKSSSSDKKQNLFYNYKVLATKNSANDFTFNILKFISTSQKETENASYLNTSSFTGTLQEYNLLDEPTRITAYKQGKIVNEINNKKQISSNYAAKTPYVGKYVLVVTDFYVDWYRLVGGKYEYVCSSYESTSVEYVYVEDDYTSGGGTTTSNYHSHYDAPHGPDLSLNNHPEEIIIDSTFKSTKAECILNKLQKMSTTFKSMIQKFDGEFPVSHLKYSVDDSLPDNVNAITDNGSEYTIEIKLNGNNLSQRTVLGLARTLIHETIHAEMYRKLRSVNYNVSINDFPGIYDYYRRHKNWQHEQMAAHYVETIVDMLKEFDNSQNSNTLYIDLAWEGLQNTVAWNNLSSSEKDRIINSVKNYKSTGTKTCN